MLFHYNFYTSDVFLQIALVRNIFKLASKRLLAIDACIVRTLFIRPPNLNAWGWYLMLIDTVCHNVSFKRLYCT